MPDQKWRVLTAHVCAGAAVKSVCSEYRIHNADVTMRDDCDIDDLVDVIEGSRVYIPAIYVINKIDQVKRPHTERAGVTKYKIAGPSGLQCTLGLLCIQSWRPHTE